jgi:hypothetical protein
MVSHRSGTRWLNDREVGWYRMWSTTYTRRWGARISWFGLKTKFDSMSVVWPQNHWGGFFRFCLKTGGNGFSRFGIKTDDFRFPSLAVKTGSYSLVTWISKSPWQFLGLRLKTRWARVCWLRYKTNGEGEDGVGHASRSSGLLRVEASRTRVSQFASKLAEVRQRVVHVASSWRSREDQVEDWRFNATDCVGPINKTLEGCDSLPLLHFLYEFRRLWLICELKFWF